MTDKEIYLNIANFKNYKTVGLDVQYKVIIDDIKHKIYVLFQESESQLDWKINFNFPSKVYKRQKSFYLVHRGYVKSWKSCNDIIMEDLISIINSKENYEIVICGWSYGGAMAQLCVEDLFYRTNIKSELITFGSPKILYFLFTKNHFKKCCSEIRQYCQRNDFVTWVIPFFFVHHLNKIKCGEKFKFKELKNIIYIHTHYHEVL